jgi:hypothetical protein
LAVGIHRLGVEIDAHSVAPVFPRDDGATGAIRRDRRIALVTGGRARAGAPQGVSSGTDTRCDDIEGSIAVVVPRDDGAARTIEMMAGSYCCDGDAGQTAFPYFIHVACAVDDTSSPSHAPTNKSAPCFMSGLHSARGIGIGRKNGVISLHLILAWP